MHALPPGKPTPRAVVSRWQTSLEAWPRAEWARWWARYSSALHLHRAHLEVRLDRGVDWDEIATIFEGAHRAVAPRGLVAVLDKPREPPARV